MCSVDAHEHSDLLGLWAITEHTQVVCV